MADNIDEEHTGNPENSPPEKPSGKIAPAAETGSLTSNEEIKIVTPIQETGPMEVHHHPHVEKKNFKEYLLEGLMIFLAVTLGFFAENIREYFADKEKERSYLESFVNDLTIDEQKLPLLINSINKQQIYGADTVSDLLNQASLNNPANGTYYFLQRMIRQQGIKIFVTDRTIEQIKNAGEMRLITNKQVSDTLTDYYKQIEYVAYLQNTLLDMKGKLWDDIKPILKGNDFRKIFTETDAVIKAKEDLYLFSTDPVTINKILLGINGVRGLSVTIRDMIVQQTKEAESIKKLIKEKYNIE
ncbi:MAG: hypothetical protein QM764_05705 [Chitinophagaceae bacterium]